VPQVARHPPYQRIPTYTDDVAQRNAHLEGEFAAKLAAMYDDLNRNPELMRADLAFRVSSSLRTAQEQRRQMRGGYSQVPNANVSMHRYGLATDAVLVRRSTGRPLTEQEIERGPMSQQAQRAIKIYRETAKRHGLYLLSENTDPLHVQALSVDEQARVYHNPQYPLFGGPGTPRRRRGNGPQAAG